MKTSEKIRQRLKDKGIRFHSNDNIADFLEGDDIEKLQKGHYRRVLSHHLKERFKILSVSLENRRIRSLKSGQKSKLMRQNS